MDSDKNQPKPLAHVEDDLTHTNVSNIWQRMVKTVRDVDMQKVTDTKEDLDTLLVFAGLFSAVVTTFVVESYSSLQRDNSDEIVFLLRQSLAQNYTFSDGILRPVVPFPTDPPFEVPLWVLRVNGLWFASLIVSLSTASFGMLVKQWLIEYLAMEQWISPQEQLRARQYRHPGLKDWKVFEIAAMLPLLLHISLGLFFLGLCLYTAAANETLGRSTFPLVAGWAFFALLTVFAPLASPRCPYKITLLKNALRLGRRYIAFYLRGPVTLLARMASDWFITPLLGLSSIITFLIIKPLSLILSCMRYIVFMLCTFALSFLVACGEFTEAMMENPLCMWPFFLTFLPLVPLGHVIALPAIIPYARNTAGLGDEEDETMQQPLKAHQLLLSVDELIINDGPILETMTKVLTQTHDPSIGPFVIGCIRHRIPTAERDSKIPDPDGRVRGLLDLRALSNSAWELLAELAADSLAATLPHTVYPIDVQPGSSNLWMANTAAVLLCNSGKPMPERTSLFLNRPTILAKLLLLVGNLFPYWPPFNVLDTIWAVLMASQTGYKVNSPRSWDRLILLGGSELDVVQQAAITILLATISGPNGSDSSTEDVELDKEYKLVVTEATMMLLSILGLLSPNSGTINEEVNIRLSRFDLTGRNISTTANDLELVPHRYNPPSSLLLVAVGSSHSLISGALTLYQTIIAGDIYSRVPFWRWIEGKEDAVLLSSDLMPVTSDLWNFVIGCAPIVVTGGDGELFSQDYIRLSLALLRPGLPRALGRDNPVGDFEALASMLASAVDHSKVPADTSGRSQDGSGTSIRDFAIRAQRRLLHNLRDVPSVLTSVLDRVALTTTGNEEPLQRRVFRGGRQRRRQSVLPEDARRLEEGLVQSEPPAVDAMRDATYSATGHRSASSANLAPSAASPTCHDNAPDGPRNTEVPRSHSQCSLAPRTDADLVPHTESTDRAATPDSDTSYEFYEALDPHHSAPTHGEDVVASPVNHTPRAESSPTNISSFHTAHTALQRSRSVPDARLAAGDRPAALASCRRRNTFQLGDSGHIILDPSNVTMLSSSSNVRPTAYNGGSMSPLRPVEDK